MDKPTVLYRGISLDDKTFQTFDLTKIPMPKDFVVNEKGEKYVSDGQEYGLYMTPSQDLGEIYANFGRSSFGTVISDICINHAELRLPHISVLYEIDATKIDIRQPKLGVFKEHQAMFGAEWITDKPIPENAFKIKEIRISADYLHDEKKIDIEGKSIGKIKAEILNEINRRENNLLDFDIAIQGTPRHILNDSFSKHSNYGIAATILFGDGKPINSLKDLAINLQLQNVEKGKFDRRTINSIFNLNNLKNTQTTLANITGIPFKTDKEISEMSLLRRFIYKESIRNAKEYFDKHPSEIPAIDTHNHSLDNQER